MTKLMIVLCMSIIPWGLLFGPWVLGLGIVWQTGGLIVQLIGLGILLLRGTAMFREVL